MFLHQVNKVPFSLLQPRCKDFILDCPPAASRRIAPTPTTHFFLYIFWSQVNIRLFTVITYKAVLLLKHSHGIVHFATWTAALWWFDQHVNRRLLNIKQTQTRVCSRPAVQKQRSKITLHKNWGTMAQWLFLLHFLLRFINVPISARLSNNNNNNNMYLVTNLCSHKQQLSSCSSGLHATHIRQMYLAEERACRDIH